jgi:hypothetical protein
VGFEDHVDKFKRTKGSALMGYTLESLTFLGIPPTDAVPLHSEIQSLIKSVHSTGKRKRKDSEEELNKKQNFSLGLTEQQQHVIWNCLVRVQIVGVTQCTGFFIQSATNSNYKHLLLNLHSFASEKQLHSPIVGFPDGHGKEFYKLVNKEIPKKIKKPVTADPIKLILSRLVFKPKEGKMEEVIEKYMEMTIEKDDIVLCDGDADAIVLFDREFDQVGVAPVSASVFVTMKVHVFGFSNVIGHDHFVVPAEVTSVKTDSILISNQSVQGFSGATVVADINGGVIAYLGGGVAKENDPFGAYSFSLNNIWNLVKREDEKKSSGESDSV